jgi:hypothetical protein
VDHHYLRDWCTNGFKKKTFYTHFSGTITIRYLPVSIDWLLKMYVGISTGASDADQNVNYGVESGKLIQPIRKRSRNHS